jgi:hypothetical protein
MSLEIIPLSRKQYEFIKQSQKVDDCLKKLEYNIEKYKILSSILTIPTDIHYLFVPKQFTKDVKQLGAIWDRSKRKWFTTRDNIHHQILIDIYHCNNFENGILKINCKTLQESNDEFFEFLTTHDI